MKSKITLFLSLIFTLSLFGQSEEGHRSINWVHGFIGSSDSWKSFDEYFSEAYDISTVRVDYPSRDGIEKCAEISMQQLIHEGKNPMVIAHSMGGLVTRKMIELGADIDGYATFGTPHAGAYFANSHLKGDVKAFTENFTDEVFADVFSAAFNPLVSGIITAVSDFFGYDDPQILGNIVFKFVNYYVKQKTDDQTISDLKAGGDCITELSEPAVPKVNFYGVEDSPVHWRFLSSFSNIEGDDQDLVNKMDQLQRYYETAYYLSMATSLTCMSWPLNWVPGCSMTGLYAGNLANELDQALNTIEQSEAVWLDLIGAIGGSHEECYTHQIYKGRDYNRDGKITERDREIRDSCQLADVNWLQGDSIVVNLGVGCTNSDTDHGPKASPVRPDPCDYSILTDEVEMCVEVYEGKKSDGFIVYDATKEDNTLKWVEIKQLNHQELRNHEKSMQLLDFLFKNSFAFQDQKFAFFKLNEK